MDLIPAGYNALIKLFNLIVIPHYRESFIASEGRGFVRIEAYKETHVYPKSYMIKAPQNPMHQLEFALKYDGVNLEILQAVFEKLDTQSIQAALTQQPTSKYTRMLWFLYEFLTEEKLQLPELGRIKYVDILDTNLYFTSNGTKSKRHGINNNLLGNRDFCPIIRKTKILAMQIEKSYNTEAAKLTNRYDPDIIRRASHYLYTKETLSSFEIEREKPSPDRMKRFIDLLQRAWNTEPLTKERLIELQNTIVDPRFKDIDYRVTQNYVGETVNPYSQKIHYISPQPEDIETLMQGLFEVIDITTKSKLHPVLIAAIISFGFVFIHPFEDGNGRIHRFLIHYILAKEQFTPPGIIFPISAVMLQKLREYDQILESFSKPLMNLITQYTLSNDGTLSVQQPTRRYYQFIDYTTIAEYLFSCIEETLRDHFEKEIEFLIKYDRTKFKIQAEIDMPDKLIDLFIKFTIQNNGILGDQKRKKYFSQLSDEEIDTLQKIVQTNMKNNINI